MRGNTTIAQLLAVLLLANLLLVAPSIGANTGSRSAADITVESVQAPAAPLFKGDNITIAASIKNLGTDNATNVTVAFTAWNKTLGQTVEIGNDTSIGHDNGGANLTGASTVQVTMYWNTSEVGKTITAGYIYTINVTAKNKTDASNLNDLNSTTVSFLDEPYLSITKADPSATTVAVGGPFNISYRVENIGSKTQDVLGDNLQLFLDNGSVPLESHAIQGLASHKAAQGLFMIDTEAITPGNHTFELGLQNAGRAVTTSNITFTAPLVSIMAINWSPNNGTVGDIITINATIVNNGTADANFVYVRFFVDPPYMTPLFEEPVNVTAGGQNVSAFLWNTTGRTVGNHTVKVSLKPEWPSENVTDNITLAAGGLPDLTVTSVTLTPDTVDIGDTVNITAVIKNKGVWPSTPTNVSFRYIKGLESTNLPMVPLKALAPDASTSVSYLWDTTGLEFWNYGVWAQADPEGDVPDANTSNNKANATLKLKAKPDLAVTGMNMTLGKDAVLAVHQGEIVTINAAVENLGTKASDATTVDLYLDDAATPMGTMKILGMIVSGGQVFPHIWNTATVSVGNHTLKAVVDPLGNNTEGNETNNALTLTVTILEPVGHVDMTVLTISIFPPAPKVGDHVAISTEVKNIGTADAVNVTIRFAYVTPGGNIAIDTQVVPLIKTDETVNQTASWATGLLASGQYDLNVTVDPLNELHEKDRSNNFKVLGTTLSPASGGPGKEDMKVDSIVLDPPKPTVGKNVKVTAAIKNIGDRDATSVRVVLLVDNIEVSSQTIPTVSKNGGSQPVEFTWKATKGMHEIKIQVYVGTSAVSDDTSSKVVKVSEGGATDINAYLPVIVVIIILLVLAIALVAAGGSKPGKDGSKKGFVEEEHDEDVSEEE